MLTLRTLANHLSMMVAGGAFVAMVAPAPAQTTSSVDAKSSKPNVIMIYTDDMGYGDISSFSKALKLKTPNIDRLATEGKKFTQFYVAMPICSPSRAAVISGRFAPETGLTNYLQERKGNYDSDQEDYVDPKYGHLPRSFQQAGYATGHIGKWHMGGGRDVDNAPSITNYGYDEAYSTWESPNRDPKLGTIYAPWDKRLVPGQVVRDKRTEYMVDKTLDFFKRHEDKPCFVTLWPDDMHTPFRPSAEMMKKHGGKPDQDKLFENFLAVLEEYDKQIGRLLDGLKEQGKDENTIIFFTGDNGPAPPYDRVRTDGMRGMKLSLYEGGIREPFVIRWPGHVKPGAVDNDTVWCTVDLLPTLTSLAGIPMTEEGKGTADGEDMSKAILGDAPVKRTKPLLYEYGRTKQVPRPKGDALSPTLAIRQGDFKVLVNYDGSDLEMYDIKKDPTEKTNVADQHKEEAQAMAKTVIDWSKTLPHRTQPYPVEPKKQ